MKSLLPLFPFVAALSLLACQGDDGPVAEGAVAPPDEVVGDMGAGGLASPTNAGAAEAADRAAAVPPGGDGMRWTDQAGQVAFGPDGAAPQIAFACTRVGAGQVLRVTRLYPANGATTGTLSFTGGGHASSIPVRAVTKPGGPGESEWQGDAPGDLANAIGRTFSRKGLVNVTLGGTPALALPTSPLVTRLIERCA